MQLRGFKDGQILDCSYGHRWPLNMFFKGFVKMSVKQTKKGNIKVSFKHYEDKLDAT
jgi:hypothetical protein